MEVFVTVKSGKLFVSWSGCTTDEHRSLLSRVKSIHRSRFDPEQKGWWIDLASADRVYKLFPEASFDYAAIVAAEDAARRRGTILLRNLLHAGMKVSLDDDKVIVTGPGVARYIVNMVKENNDTLVALVKEGVLDDPR